MPQFTLMAVFAHPDDESLGMGGTLARYGFDPDVRVVLVCATRGEAGEISDPHLATPDQLGLVREKELRCACRALGIDDLFLLGYRDSGMAGTPDNRDPRALVMVDADKVVGQIVAHIRRERPDVVVTFDETGAMGIRIILLFTTTPRRRSPLRPMRSAILGRSRLAWSPTRPRSYTIQPFRAVSFANWSKS